LRNFQYTWSFSLLFVGFIYFLLFCALT
jgi:hypothetical protein